MNRTAIFLGFLFILIIFLMGCCKLSEYKKETDEKITNKTTINNETNNSSNEQYNVTKKWEEGKWYDIDGDKKNDIRFINNSFELIFYPDSPYPEPLYKKTRYNAYIEEKDRNNDSRIDYIGIDYTGDFEVDFVYADDNFDGKTDHWLAIKEGSEAWDLDNDGIPDIYDINADGNIDAWDLDADGNIDVIDIDNDGIPDLHDFDFDGIYDELQ